MSRMPSTMPPRAYPAMLPDGHASFAAAASAAARLMPAEADFDFLRAIAFSVRRSGAERRADVFAAARLCWHRH